MALIGLDVATTTGIAIEPKSGPIRAYSFRPRAKRPFEAQTGKIHYEHDGRLFDEWRVHLRTLLNDLDEAGDQVNGVAIEEPLRSNITFRKAVVDTSSIFAGQAVSYEEKGGTTMATIYRAYNLHGIAASLCAVRNIPLFVVNQKTWRSSFFRGGSPPRGTDNASAWWKNHAKKQCEMLRINVPNADAAEAVGILFWLKAKIDPKYAAAESLFSR